ncbi:hypothetical protein ACRALDRAFT_2023449 [Sodiomyces alcalophilus JCM 7366]|uniref:uncharacterized protein n=1 Tax=Sodiomyces alcalophilus JCM 7366 TaxID=591952 RepID=UPI0039B6CC31
MGPSLTHDVFACRALAQHGWNRTGYVDREARISTGMITPCALYLHIPLDDLPLVVDVFVLVAAISGANKQLLRRYTYLVL